MTQLPLTQLLGLSLLILAFAYLSTVSSESTTPTPDQYNCSAHSSSCDSCVKSSSHCYYCSKTKKCNFYPWTDLKPTPTDCDFNDVYFKTCAVPANVLAIVLGSLAGLIGLIILSLLAWCCLIRPCVRKCNEKQEAKWERNRLRLSEMQSQRRKERQQDRDAIRAKYGLGGPAYDKF